MPIDPKEQLYAYVEARKRRLEAKKQVDDLAHAVKRGAEYLNNWESHLKESGLRATRTTGNITEACTIAEGQAVVDDVMDLRAGQEIINALQEYLQASTKEEEAWKALPEKWKKVLPGAGHG